jgi:hypothetical protein
MSFHYEKANQPLVPTRVFLGRLAHHGGIAGIIVLGSIGLGTAGYCVFARETVLDAFLNACMLLGGMGPVGDLTTAAGKVFAALFALYAGLVFIAVSGLLLAPVMHRVIHWFHVGKG